MDIASKSPEWTISLGSLNDKNYEMLHIINKETLPVSYNKYFYQKVAVEYNKFSKFAFLYDVIVGAITCREEEKEGKKCLYILTFGVLPAYRSHGIGSKLLHEIESMAISDGNIDYIYLHVHVLNETAKNFYTKQNYTQLEEIKGYYKNIDTPDALLFKKELKKVE